MSVQLDSIVRQIADQSVASLLTLLGAQSNGLREAIESQMTGLLKSAESQGVLEARWSGEKLEALFLLSPQEEGPMGLPATICKVNGDMTNPAILQWFERTFAKHLGRIDSSFDLGLYPWAWPLIPVLEGLGFYREFEITYGFSGPALENLLDMYPSLKRFPEGGLSVERLTDEREVLAVMEIMDQEIQGNSSYRWFKDHPEYLETRRFQMIQSLADPDSYPFVIRDETRKILGYFGMTLKRKYILWGSCAGVEFFFDPAIRGRGIVKLAYRHLLEILIRERIAVFYGGTLQPAILHLNEVMQRQPLIQSIRKAKLN